MLGRGSVCAEPHWGSIKGPSTHRAHEGAQIEIGPSKKVRAQDGGHQGLCSGHHPVGSHGTQNQQAPEGGKHRCGGRLWGGHHCWGGGNLPAVCASQEGVGRFGERELVNLSA